MNAQEGDVGPLEDTPELRRIILDGLVSVISKPDTTDELNKGRQQIVWDLAVRMRLNQVPIHRIQEAIAIGGGIPHDMFMRELIGENSQKKVQDVTKALGKLGMDRVKETWLEISEGKERCNELTVEGVEGMLEFLKMGLTIGASKKSWFGLARELKMNDAIDTIMTAVEARRHNSPAEIFLESLDRDKTTLGEFFDVLDEVDHDPTKAPARNIIEKLEANMELSIKKYTTPAFSIDFSKEIYRKKMIFYIALDRFNKKGWLTKTEKSQLTPDDIEMDGYLLTKLILQLNREFEGHCRCYCAHVNIDSYHLTVQQPEWVGEANYLYYMIKMKTSDGSEDPRRYCSFSTPESRKLWDKIEPCIEMSISCEDCRFRVGLDDWRFPPITMVVVLTKELNCKWTREETETSTQRLIQMINDLDLEDNLMLGSVVQAPYLRVPVEVLTNDEQVMDDISEFHNDIRERIASTCINGSPSERWAKLQQFRK